MENSIALYVHGKNELNRVAYEIAKNAIGDIEKFIDQKIKTVSGFTKKFNTAIKLIKPEVNPFTENGFGRVHLSYLKTENYSSVLQLKLSIVLSGGQYENNTHYTQYFDTIIQIGEMIGDKLLNVSPIVKPEIIDLKNELKKIDTYVKIQQQADSKRKDIKIPFELYKHQI